LIIYERLEEVFITCGRCLIGRGCPACRAPPVRPKEFFSVEKNFGGLAFFRSNLADPNFVDWLSNASSFR
jgi:hypothetical protein